jgi:hypothetical protein
MTRPACVSDALAVLARSTGIQHGEVGVAHTVVLGYIHQLEHRVQTVEADAALVRWARADMAAVERLRAAVGAALEGAETLGEFVQAVEALLTPTREVAG